MLTSPLQLETHPPTDFPAMSDKVAEFTCNPMLKQFGKYRPHMLCIFAGETIAEFWGQQVSHLVDIQKQSLVYLKS